METQRKRKPLKTYSRKHTRQSSQESGQLYLNQAKPRQSGQLSSSKKSRSAARAKTTGSSTGPPSKQKSRHRSAKKRIFAVSTNFHEASRDDSWIYASPLHSSAEVYHQDQAEDEPDDIDPTPVPRKRPSSSHPNKRLPDHKRKKIPVNALRQQLNTSTLIRNNPPSVGVQRRAKKAKPPNAVRSPIRRNAIQEGGDGFLSSELLPPSANKRQLNGRPKASSFCISSAALRLAKGPLPSVRFLTVFEAEQEREGGGALQLWRTKIVEPEVDDAREVYMYLDGIEAQASDKTPLEEQSPRLARKFGRSAEGLTIDGGTRAQTVRTRSENLFAASPEDSDALEQVTQLDDDPDTAGHDSSDPSNKQRRISHNSSASENEVMLPAASPPSPRPPSSTPHSPTPASSPPNPEQTATHHSPTEISPGPDSITTNPRCMQHHFSTTKSRRELDNNNHDNNCLPRSRNPSNKHTLFDEYEDEAEDAYFSLLLESESDESCSALSDDEVQHDNEASGADVDEEDKGSPLVKTILVPRSSMVMETFPHPRTVRGAGAVQVPRASVVKDTTPLLRQAYCASVAMNASPHPKHIYGYGYRGSTVSLRSHAQNRS